MNINFHTHTYRCGHATGTEQDYARAAVDAGIKVLGFSDHCPIPFPKDYDRSRISMGMEELPNYVAEVLKVREEYEGRLEIRLGFELEYYPAYFSSIIKELEKYPVEYLILGQHFVGNEIGEPYMGRPLGEDILRRYVDQTIEGMETGCFLYLAHPDLPRYTGDEKFYAGQMRRLCEAALRLNIPLEINLLGMKSGRNYPDARFWKIAGETGNLVVIGCDAHHPESLRDKESETKAQELAARYHLNLCTVSPSQITI